MPRSDPSLVKQRLLLNKKRRGLIRGSGTRSKRPQHQTDSHLVYVIVACR